MITQNFDYFVARFDSFEEVTAYELEQADIIHVRGFVPGGIYHSLKMFWVGKLSGITRPEQFIRSKKERKVIYKNQQYLENQGYHFGVKLGTENLFRQFKALYEATILTKERALVFDVDRMLKHIQNGDQIYFAGMFKGKEMVSSLMFSLVDAQRASVIFGAKERIDTLRGGVGGVLEMKLIQFCLDRGMQFIRHGVSGNPAGLTGSAGIFEFKTRYGFTAYPDKSWVTTFIRRPSISLSDLVFVSIVNNQIGYVVVSDQAEKEVKKRYQAREVQAVSVLSIDRVKDQFAQFYQQVAGVAYQPHYNHPTIDVSGAAALYPGLTA